jgi:hypothetical protein
MMNWITFVLSLTDKCQTPEEWDVFFK